jgi:hypothetical protein
MPELHEARRTAQEAEALLVANVRLVWHCLRYFRDHPAHEDDLLSDGLVALWRGAAVRPRGRGDVRALRLPLHPLADDALPAPDLERAAQAPAPLQPPRRRVLALARRQGEARRRGGRPARRLRLPHAPGQRPHPQGARHLHPPGRGPQPDRRRPRAGRLLPQGRRHPPLRRRTPARPHGLRVGESRLGGGLPPTHPYGTAAHPRPFRRPNRLATMVVQGYGGCDVLAYTCATTFFGRREGQR